MTASFVAYVDESGDEGFKTLSQRTRQLTLVCVVGPGHSQGKRFAGGATGPSGP